MVNNIKWWRVVRSKMLLEWATVKSWGQWRQQIQGNGGGRNSMKWIGEWMGSWEMKQCRDAEIALPRSFMEGEKSQWLEGYKVWRKIQWACIMAANPMFTSMVSITLLLFFVQKWPWTGAEISTQLGGTHIEAWWPHSMWPGIEGTEASRYVNQRWSFPDIRSMETSDQARVREQQRHREQPVCAPIFFLVLIYVYHSNKCSFFQRRHKWPDFLFLIIKKA